MGVGFGVEKPSDSWLAENVVFLVGCKRQTQQFFREENFFQKKNCIATKINLVISKTSYSKTLATIHSNSVCGWGGGGRGEYVWHYAKLFWSIHFKKQNWGIKGYAHLNFYINIQVALQTGFTTIFSIFGNMLIFFRHFFQIVQERF